PAYMPSETLPVAATRTLMPCVRLYDCLPARCLPRASEPGCTSTSPRKTHTSVSDDGPTVTPNSVPKSTTFAVGVVSWNLPPSTLPVKRPDSSFPRAGPVGVNLDGP